MPVNFFENPILKSPYGCPDRHLELDGDDKCGANAKQICWSMARVTSASSVNGSLPISPIFMRSRRRSATWLTQWCTRLRCSHA